MSTALYLRFADEAAALAAFAALGLAASSEGGTAYLPDVAWLGDARISICTLGTLYRPTGATVTTDEGEVPEMAPIAGWHVNVLVAGAVPDFGDAVIAPEPGTPDVVWNPAP